MKWMILLSLSLLSVFSMAGATNYHRTRLQAELQEDLSALNGILEMEYSNHSCDTLHQLYFLLYYNTQTGGGMEINSFSIQGRDSRYSVSDGVMRVDFFPPLLPGDSVLLSCQFHAIIPAIGDRWGVLGNHLILGAWYPQIAVYDQAGWHTRLTREGEFYQEYGDFEVQFLYPDSMIVLTTGQEMYKEPVVHAGKKWIRASYTARHVQDFCLAMDPEFLPHSFEWNGIPVMMAYFDYHSHLWEGMDRIIVSTLQWLHDHIGPGYYNGLKVVAGFVSSGGIEYPGMVVINANVWDKNELQRIVIHEIVHQYFFGALGNNQTEEGWLDEGFTTFLEDEIANSLGIVPTYAMPWPPKNLFSGILPDPLENADMRIQNYIISQRKEQFPSDWPMDWYTGDRYFYHYERPLLILKSVKHYLSDSLFYAALRTYYANYRGKHPGIADLIRILNRETGMQIGEVLWDLIRTSRPVDVAIRKVEERKNDAHSWDYTITLESKGDTPGFVRLIFQNDSHQVNLAIPVSPVMKEENGTMSTWTREKKEYRFHFQSDFPVKRIMLDPFTCTLDVDWSNNVWPKPLPLVVAPPLREDEPPLPGIAILTPGPSVFYDDYSGLIPQFSLEWRKGLSFWAKSMAGYAVKSSRLHYSLRITKNYALSGALNFGWNAWVEDHFLFRNMGWSNEWNNATNDNSATLEWGMHSYRPGSKGIRNDPLLNFPSTYFIFLAYHRFNHSYYWNELFYPYQGIRLLMDQLDYPSLEGMVMLPLHRGVDWYVYTGIHGMLSHARTNPLLIGDGNGNRLLDYLENPVHRYPGIIPATYFSDHQTMTDPIAFVRVRGDEWIPSRAGLWHTFIFQNLSLDELISRLPGTRQLHLFLIFWMQQRGILPVGGLSGDQWIYEMNSGVSCRFLLSRWKTWLPDIGIHFPLTSFSNQSLAAPSRWLLEVRL